MLKFGVFYDRLRPSSTWLMQIAHNFLILSRVDFLLSQFMVYSPQPYSLSTVVYESPRANPRLFDFWKKQYSNFPLTSNINEDQLNKWIDEKKNQAQYLHQASVLPPCHDDRIKNTDNLKQYPFINGQKEHNETCTSHFVRAWFSLATQANVRVYREA